MEIAHLVQKPGEMANCQQDLYVAKVESLIRKIKTSGRNLFRYLDAAFQKWEDKDKVQIFKFRIIMLAETSRLISTLAESTSHEHDKLESIIIKF